MFGNFIDVIVSALAVLGLLIFLLAYQKESHRLDSEYQIQKDWLEEQKCASKAPEDTKKGAENGEDTDCG